MFDSKRYKETFSQVQASEETLTEVLNMAKKNRSGGFRAARMILIAAVVTCLLATTAFAYVGFTQYENPMEMLGTFFGNEEKQSDNGQIVHETYYDWEYDWVQPTIERVPLDEEVAEEQVAPYISDVGKSISYEDYTLTIVAHQYDSVTDCGIIYYTLENPNGVSGYELQYDGEVWWPGGEKIKISGIAEQSYIIESETTDTKLSVACYYVRAFGDSDELSVEFYQWIAYKPGEMTEAQWIEWETNKPSMTLSVDDGGGMKGLTIADGQIALSPIAICIRVGQMDFLRQVEEYDGSVTPPLASNIEYLSIRYKDGTEYVLQSDEPAVDNTTYALIEDDGSELEDKISFTFNRIVDINEVEAVIINGVEFTDIQNTTEEQRHEASLDSGDTQSYATEPVNP